MDIGISDGMQRDNNVWWLGRVRVKVTGVVSRLSYIAKTTALIYLLTYSFEQTPSSEANRFSARQEIPCTLWNPKVHYRNHNREPPVPILSQFDPVTTPTSHFLKIHLNIILPCIWVSQVVSFPQVSPPKPSPFQRSATCPAHLILLDFITWTLLGEKYRSLSTSLCSFLHSPVTLFQLETNILLNTLFLHTLRVHSFLNVRDQVSHPYKTTGKILVLYGVSQEECARLRESVPYGKLYRYNPKHLCPK